MTEVHFEHGSENESKYEWCSVVIELPKKVTDHSENHHDTHIEDTIVDAVGSYDTKEQYSRKENPIGNLQNFYPKRDEREV